MAFLKTTSLALAFILAVPAAARLEESAPLEEQVKAAYIYNFARFVEWPTTTFPSAESPLVIGVAEDKAFSAYLKDTLASRTIASRPLVVKTVSSTEEAAQCQIVYILDGQAAKIAERLRRMNASDVLTIGDSKSFLDAGGMVAFIFEKNTVRFSINLPALQKTRLKVSSQMLQFAEIVGDKNKDEMHP